MPRSADPYEDPTYGARHGHDEDPTQAGKNPEGSYADPTQGVTIPHEPDEDPTQGRGNGENRFEDPTQGTTIRHEPNEDPTEPR